MVIVNDKDSKVRDDINDDIGDEAIKGSVVHLTTENKRVTNSDLMPAGEATSHLEDVGKNSKHSLEINAFTDAKGDNQNLADQLDMAMQCTKTYRSLWGSFFLRRG